MALPGAKANTSGAGSLRSESEAAQRQEVVESWSIAVGEASASLQQLKAGANTPRDEAFARMGK
jgi:hypothetical protein